MTWTFLPVSDQQAASLFTSILADELGSDDLIMTEAGWGEVVTSQFGPGDQPFTSAMSLVGSSVDRLQERFEAASNGMKVAQLAPDLVAAVAEYGGAGSPASTGDTDGSAYFGTVNAQDADNAGFLNQLQRISRTAIDRGGHVCAVSMP